MGVPTISSSTFCFAPCNFNPPAPMGVPTFANKSEISRTYKFQSTAPLGVPTAPAAQMQKELNISIHGTLGGADGEIPKSSISRNRFQSTAPLGVPTQAKYDAETASLISIHGTLGGADTSRSRRLKSCWKISIHGTLGGADALLWGHSNKRRISIHGTLGGADFVFVKCAALDFDFNPRHPWGCRPVAKLLVCSRCRNFNPRHPWGCRPDSGQTGGRPGDISIHGTLGGADE